MENGKAEIVVRLCAVIAGALPEAVQGVKWNAPNFAVRGVDLITLNLSPRHPVRVIFHRGASAVDSKTGQRLVADPDRRLTWATDQRATVGFSDLAEVERQALWLAGFCQTWVAAALTRA